MNGAPDFAVYLSDLGHPASRTMIRESELQRVIEDGWTSSDAEMAAYLGLIA